MGPAGADVRRLDSGTSSFPDSVRLLRQSLAALHAKDDCGRIVYTVLLHLVSPLEGSRIPKSHHLRLQWHRLFCAPVKLSSRPRRRYVVAEAMFYSARD